MRLYNPFDSTREYVKATALALLIGISGWALGALAAQGKIPGFFAWPGVTLFVIGWIYLAIGIVARFIYVIRRLRQ